MKHNEAELEKEIVSLNLTAPRLTPVDIDNAIVGESFTILPSGRTTICELTLRNGFTVRGESSCVSIENFNKAVGEKVARDDARSKVWQLEAYLLTDKLNKAKVFKGSDNDETVRAYTEQFIGMFIGWLTADIYALHHTHPDILAQSWERFKGRMK